MDLSIIIATHNRGTLLKRALDNVSEISRHSRCANEIIVVDNNSSDSTRKMTSDFRKNFENVRYVFEGRTSLSKARNTGGYVAKGKYLLFLDDDVIVKKGSFDEIVSTFNRLQRCGVIAGRIMPKFLEKAPVWIGPAQKIFNGLSLYDKKYLPNIKKDFQEVLSANGPMMAVRKNLFHKIGGYPPDTIGVETNLGGKEFRKLFIGPGDYGLCTNARREGYKIYYSNKVSCFHLIPPTRLTRSFWRARMISEGQYEATSSRYFFSQSQLLLGFRLLAKKSLYLKYKNIFSSQIERRKSNRGQGSVSPEELLLHYNRSFFEMSYVLDKNKSFGRYLWKIGKEGVSDKEYEKVVRKMPRDYKVITSSKYMYNESPLKALEQYEDTFEVLDKSLYRTDFFSSGMIPFLSILDTWLRIRKNVYLQRVYLKMTGFLSVFKTPDKQDPIYI